VVVVAEVDRALKGTEDFGEVGTERDELEKELEGPPNGRLGRISVLALKTLAAEDSFWRNSEGRGTRNDDFLDTLPLDEAVVMDAVVAFEADDEEEAKPDLLALSIS
jgi:hypothetical protein